MLRICGPRTLQAGTRPGGALVGVRGDVGGADAGFPSASGTANGGIGSPGAHAGRAVGFRDDRVDRDQDEDQDRQQAPRSARSAGWGRPAARLRARAGPGGLRRPHDRSLRPAHARPARLGAARGTRPGLPAAARGRTPSAARRAPAPACAPGGRAASAGSLALGDHEHRRQRDEHAHERDAQVDQRHEAEVAQHPDVREAPARRSPRSRSRPRRPPRRPCGGSCGAAPRSCRGRPAAPGGGARRAAR